MTRRLSTLEIAAMAREKEGYNIMASFTEVLTQDRFIAPFSLSTFKKPKPSVASINYIQHKGAFMREDEAEDEPEQLDQYDEFYKTTKSLLVLFQLMGIMPIERSGIGLTTYRWFSKTSIFAYILFLSETIFVSIVFKERLELILKPGKRFDEYIYGIIFLSILVPHFMLPTAWINGPEVARFKNMWTKFQLKFFRVTGTPLKFPHLSIISWSLCVLSWAVSICIILAQYYLQEDFLLWHTFAYYHILAMLNGLCSLWYINCTAKGSVASKLADHMQKSLDNSDSSGNLSEVRDLWVDLSHMMQQLGKAYSGMYGMYCILILLTTIVASYGCITEILDHGVSFKLSGLFLIAFYCMSLLYIICNEAYHLSHKMGAKFRERLLNVNLTALDHKTQQEIQMFLTALEKNPPVMNLNGYADVNRKLITTTLTSMATYLVMLMQFRLALMRNASLAARRAAQFAPPPQGNSSTVPS